MRKICLTILMLFLGLSVGVSSARKLNVVTADHYLSYRFYDFNYKNYKDFLMMKSWLILEPNEIVSYTIEFCIQENVNAIDMLCLLKVENPKMKLDATNNNYKEKYDRKKKKMVRYIDSTDTGLYQQNSKHLAEFITRYWTPYETEKFDIYNYKHNIRLAVRMYKDLHKKLKTTKKSIMAYNAGYTAVKTNQIPDRTKNLYLPNFLRYKTKFNIK